MHSPCVRKIVYDSFVFWVFGHFLNSLKSRLVTYFMQFSWLRIWDIIYINFNVWCTVIRESCRLCFLLPYDIYCGICLFTIFMYTQLLDRYQPCPCLLGTPVALVQRSHQKPVHVEYLKRVVGHYVYSNYVTLSAAVINVATPMYIIGDVRCKDSHDQEPLYLCYTKVVKRYTSISWKRTQCNY